MINYILVIICSVFSFTCALLKQLYDVQYYPKNMYVFIIDVALSGISGVTFGLIISEHIKNELAVIGLSGLGGMFGVAALKMLMKLKLGRKIKVQFSLDDDLVQGIKHDYVPEKDIINNSYNRTNDKKQSSNQHKHIKIVDGTKDSL